MASWDRGDWATAKGNVMRGLENKVSVDCDL